MVEYIGTKIVQAEPAKDGEGRDGYKVVYEDGYESWSPKGVFERAYRPTCAGDFAVGMDFGGALNLLKAGRKVARRGWNGKGMFLVRADEIDFDTDAKVKTGLPAGPSVAMKTAQNTWCVGWLASQSDMFAEDWVEVRD